MSYLAAIRPVKEGTPESFVQKIAKGTLLLSAFLSTSSKKEYPVGYSKTVVQTFQRRSAFQKALQLQMDAQSALGNDCHIGKKLSFYFSQIKLSDVILKVTSDIYSSPEKRELLATYSAAAWRDAPWSHFIRKQSWATEEEIFFFQKMGHLSLQLGVKPWGSKPSGPSHKRLLFTFPSFIIEISFI